MQDLNIPKKTCLLEPFKFWWCKLARSAACAQRVHQSGLEETNENLQVGMIHLLQMRGCGVQKQQQQQQQQ